MGYRVFLERRPSVPDDPDALRRLDVSLQVNYGALIEGGQPPWGCFWQNRDAADTYREVRPGVYAVFVIEESNVWRIKRDFRHGEWRIVDKVEEVPNAKSPNRVAE